MYVQGTFPALKLFDIGFVRFQYVKVTMRKHILLVQGDGADDKDESLYSLSIEGYTEEEAMEIAQAVPASQCGLWDVTDDVEREVMFIENTQQEKDNA